jgi:hypothetical protein
VSEVGEAPASDAIPDELAKLGIISGDEAKDNAFARVLLLGPAKGGKTTCVATTAPDPLIINCDGDSATKYAAKTLRDNNGKAFMQIDVPRKGVRAAWKRAVSAAEKAVSMGAARTVIVDTVSLLGENVVREVSLTLEGFERWGEIGDVLKGGLAALLDLEAHVFILGHMIGNHEDAAGIMPMLKGDTKVWLPAKVDDWVLLDVEAGRKPERQFLLGPQKQWNHSGRNIKRTCAIEATVPALFKELGLTL